jgi:DNA-binding IclR family transcriptional regulator
VDVTSKPDPAADNGAVKSADRVVTLLERLAESSSELSHTDLAEALAIPKSSLSQLLKTLLARRWLTYSPDAKTYGLGPAVSVIARRAQQVVRVPELAADILARLTAATSETCAVNLLMNGDESEVVATVLSPQRLLSTMRLGDRAPLYATSGGKAMLAFLAPSAIAAYLARVRFVPFTNKTLSSRARLSAELVQIRGAGFALSREEYTAGVIGLACPVIDATGVVLAAVNIAMPASRYSPKAHPALINQLRRATAELTARLARA